MIENNNSFNSKRVPHQTKIIDNCYQKLKPFSESENTSQINTEDLISKVGLDEIRNWDELLLWVRPSECCLQIIGKFITQQKLKGIASIGCGTGLLEWLIQNKIGN